MNANVRPPRWADHLLEVFLAPHLREDVQGDLQEVFYKRVRQVGVARARREYAWAVLHYLTPFFHQRKPSEYPTPATTAMLRNYLKIAWRNLLKHKGYSFINIGGLSVGMAVAMLIGLWVQHQLSYDGFHARKQNIAIVMKKTFFNNEKGTQTGVMLPLYDELRAHYPEVKHSTRLDWGDQHSFIIGDKKISKPGHYADPDFLKMFSFPLVKGHMDKALKEPYSIVLTESFAKALFGTIDPIGKPVKMDNQYNLMVTGVMKDVPKNSTITFDFLLPYELNVATSDFVRNAKTQWQNNFLQTFVELQDGVSMDAFSNRIEHIVQQKVNDKKESALFVHPMEKWHLYSDFKEWINIGGAIELVRLFGIIGALVLLIACINFMNLSTARSEKRAREVGIRKAIGSRRNQLIMQFLGDALLTTFIAFVLSLLLTKLALPLLANVGFQDINFSFGDFYVVSVALAGCLLTGLVAGSYPALYLSGFAPVNVLKGTYRAGKSADVPRKILVVTQFSFSIALIIGTSIVFQQIQHAKNRPLGYNPDHLLAVGLSADLKKNYRPLKRDLLATGYVEAISTSSSPMTGVWNQWDNFSWPGKDPTSRPLFSAIMVDLDYEKAAGIQLKEGRFFSKEFVSDSNSVVLNEAALKVMGLKKTIGNTIKMGNETLTVIGITKNVMMENPYAPVMPAIMIFRDYFIGQGIVRLKVGANLKDALAALQPVFEKYNPGSSFDYRFVDEEFNRKFSNETQVGQLAALFAVLAIFISYLGLFGLASFVAEQRTKEIGVRKVLGASVLNLCGLLSKEFVLLVLIAFGIAAPFSYYVLNNWLQKYDYRAELSWWIFAASGLGSLLIALLTVSFQSIKAALMNPVKSLRSE